MKFSFTKNPESDFLKNPNLAKLEQVSRGSRIPPASDTAFGKQTFYIKL